MDGPGIQKLVDLGFKIAADVTGFTYDLYRPTDPLRPLRLLDKIGPIKATFDARPSLKFAIPPATNDATRYGIMDNAAVLEGDYLVGEQETFFVAHKSIFYAAVCFRCNAVLSMRRLIAPGGFGAVADRSDASTGEATLFQGWPATLLFAGRGRGGADNLPGDLPSPEYTINLPIIPGIPAPQPEDVIVDEHNRRFAVAWWEKGEVGWRIVARLMMAG